MSIGADLQGFCRRLQESEMMDTTTELSRGYAHGGVAAAQDALKLWLQCAVGNADCSQLPFSSAQAFTRLRTAIAGFEAAVEALGYWNAERVGEFQTNWRRGASETLTKAAGHLLVACEQVERGNRADADFAKGPGYVGFSWTGTWTRGRWVDFTVHFEPALRVSLHWKTGTGAESSYLGLPSMTDEAEKVGDRRDGGWNERGPES